MSHDPGEVSDEEREKAVIRLFPLMHHLAWKYAFLWRQDVDEMYSCFLEGSWKAALRADFVSDEKRFKNYAVAWAIGRAKQWIVEQIGDRKKGYAKPSPIAFSSMYPDEEKSYELSATEEIDATTLPFLSALALKCLTPVERRVIWERYWKGRYLQEIGSQLGYTHAGISEIEARAITKMRVALNLERPAPLKPRKERAPDCRTAWLILEDGRKLCRLCLEPKELDEFRPQKTAKGGRGSECLDCYRKMQRERMRRTNKQAKLKEVKI